MLTSPVLFIVIVPYECVPAFDVVTGLAFFQHLLLEEVQGEHLMTKRCAYFDPGSAGDAETPKRRSVFVLRHVRPLTVIDLKSACCFTEDIISLRADGTLAVDKLFSDNALKCAN